MDDENLPAEAASPPALPARTFQEKAEQSESPLAAMLWRVANDIDLENAVAEWAEENTAAFLRIMIELERPAGGGGGGSGGGQFNVHLHPALRPGPLDAGHTGTVIDHSDE